MHFSQSGDDYINICKTDIDLFSNQPKHASLISMILWTTPMDVFALLGSQCFNPLSRYKLGAARKSL